MDGAGGLKLLCAGDSQPEGVFTSFVEPTVWKTVNSSGPSQTNLPDLATIDAHIKSSKVKRIVRSSNWPICHEARRQLWVILCNASFDCKVVCDETSYKEAVKDIFGEGERKLFSYLVTQF